MTLPEPSKEPEAIQPPPPVPVDMLRDIPPKKRGLRVTLTGLTMALTMIIGPTLLATVYYFGFATDKFEASTVLSLRSAHSSGGSSTLLGFLPGANALGRAGDESHAMISYIRSRDAAMILDGELSLRKSFSAPDIDAIQRLSADATFEDFYNYYSQMVSIYYDELTGQIHLDTRAFDPTLAHQLAVRIKAMSEALVNQFNARSERDVLDIARREVAAAEQRLRDADGEVTRFRIEKNNVDPVASTSAIGGIIGQLLAQVAQIQAQIRAERQLSGGAETSSISSLTNRLRAIEAQISDEQARLTGQNGALAPVLEEYQNLLIAQEIARQSYTAALTSLQSALAESQRQKLYIVDIVSPTEPEESRLPKRGRAVIFTFLISVGVWFAFRLVVAAIRDHIV